MRLFSRSFRADRASIILQELGLAHQSLRQHLAKRRKFFNSKRRLQELKSLVSAEDAELDLDRKMLAVVSKADQPELFDIVRTLFHSMAGDGVLDLEARPPAWVRIKKFELDEPFWALVETAFGYGEDSPTLQNLLIRLLVFGLCSPSWQGTPQCPAAPPITVFRRYECCGFPGPMERQQQQEQKLQRVGGRGGGAPE